MTPTVTIYSSWYNREHRVYPSLEHLFAQDYPHTEFVLIDDGSTDETGERIEAFCRERGDRNATVIRQRNKGLTRTLIDAIDSGSSDYIALLGAGDLCAPEKITRQIEIAESSKSVGVVGCGVGYCSETGIDPTRAHHAPKEHTATHSLPKRIPRPGTHGAALIRRESYEQAGGYRAAFKYAQDADLWLRLAPLCDFRTVPETLYWKYQGSGTVLANPERSLVQALHSELAWQSSEARWHGRPDPVDVLGDDATYFLRPTWRLEARILKKAWRLMRQGELTRAAAVLTAVRAATPLGGALKALASIATRAS
ncbi:glycosyltransferase family 2 protein [Halorhodospira abdelmalekii]|uniref:glycosyltransferase family 2 protein n=1 Tax=Halorhodospira abdelmalekii TaxID=421629 RepID=UPI001903C5F1|nr:glycosyltransferase family 2 protein [Halorhodospira abdelmalekii]